MKKKKMSKGKIVLIAIIAFFMVGNIFFSLKTGLSQS